MKPLTSRNIQGHTKLQFNTSSDASKAHSTFKKLLKKVADDEEGIIVLTGRTLIIPKSLYIIFTPANAVVI